MGVWPLWGELIIMPGGKRRLRQLLVGGANITGAASLKGATALEGTVTQSGRHRVGTGSHYTQLAACSATYPGRQTMVGKARVRKEIFLSVNDFVQHADDGIDNRLLVAGSLRLAPSGSIMTTAGSNLMMPVLTTLAKQTASPYIATAIFNVPPDHDTSGSVIVYVDFTRTGTVDSN